MVNVILPDCIIHDILARLPTKVLYRCKCVSKHWNSLTKDPYFIKMRSRRMILLPSLPIQVLDDNYPNDDMANLMFKLRSPYGNPQNNNVVFLGTFNGIVLLVVNDKHLCNTYACTRMILYNPFTGASKLIPDPVSDLGYCFNHIYGFGYGATLEDLKILRFSTYYNSNHDTLYVFSFRTNSWSRSISYNIKHITFNENDVGTFLNGYLHWIVYKDHMMIMALNLDNMVPSFIPVPRLSHDMMSRLATLHGCLCIIDINSYIYDRTQLLVSVMKEKDVWSKQCLFISGLEVINIQEFAPLTILDDGRILMMNYPKELIIYDTLKQSYKVLELSEKLYYSRGLSGIEYVETLASPSDLFAV